MRYSCTKSYWKILLIDVVLLLLKHGHSVSFRTSRISEAAFGQHRSSSTPRLQPGQQCTSNSDCTQMSSAHCHDGICACRPYHIRYNDTLCLPASLLGFRCLASDQCRMIVPNSKCVDNACSCEDGFVKLRKDKCLAGAKIGDLCANDEQCQLSSRQSHCKFIIPRVYGRCVCDVGLVSTKDDLCVPSIGTRCRDHSFCQSAIRHSQCGHHGSDTSPAFRIRQADPIYLTRGALSPGGADSLRSLLHFHSLYSQQIHNHRQIRSGTNASRVLRGLVHGPHHKYCLCEKGFRASVDKRRCVTHARVATGIPVSLGKPCQRSDQCQLRDPYSTCVDNLCQCTTPDPNCNANSTGCHKDTFQCLSGQCISWFFVCNGLYNCDDGSDEQDCIRFKCPKEAFQCRNGDCISRGKLCNGKKDCFDGSDELNCYGDCDTNKVFRCTDGACLPQYMFCNAVSSCKDKSDEDPAACELGTRCPREQFQCGNGRCRSTAILCSGKDGCGDNSDENKCKVCACPKPR